MAICYGSRTPWENHTSINPAKVKGSRPCLRNSSIRSTIPEEMPLDENELIKPIRKTKKAIEKLSSIPSPEEVHGLRTQSRRLEAILHALKLDRRRSGHKLLKHVTPIRKAAGKVRDMDVLIGLASGISCETKAFQERKVQLLEALGAKRRVVAKRLRQLVNGDRKRALRILRNFSSRLDRWIDENQRKGALAQTDRADPAAFTMSRAGALSAWPSLNRSNLHSYRLEIKQLRYVVELSQDADKALLRALGETKDSIGEWHDWCELEDRARELLGSGDLVRQIHAIADQRFQKALRIASNLQNKYFAAQKQNRRTHPGQAQFKEPVLISAAKMSA